MAERDTAAGQFKRVLTIATRTIAGDHELAVAFGNETPVLSGNKAKLPQVGNDFSARDIAITRGHADSFALRLSSHSDQVHARYRPEGKNARAVFEAVEQARVEALGSNAMPGMAGNLTAMLDDRYRRKDVARYTDRSDAPLDEAELLAEVGDDRGHVRQVGHAGCPDPQRPARRPSASLPVRVRGAPRTVICPFGQARPFPFPKRFEHRKLPETGGSDARRRPVAL